MKTFINSKEIDTDGSSYVGSINCTYQYLVNVFGKETIGLSGDLKSQCSWNLKFDDGTIATIYDWKVNKKYCGVTGINKENVTRWMVGGFNQKTIELITNKIKLKTLCQILNLN